MVDSKITVFPSNRLLQTLVPHKIANQKEDKKIKTRVEIEAFIFHLFFRILLITTRTDEKPMFALHVNKIPYSIGTRGEDLSQFSPLNRSNELHMHLFKSECAYFASTQ
mmetsp:Transcript_13686/g.17515  ORF Transcript_13686/g.17515 Transcript_13686/m.17515 type:complete len:109 (+) Transcript_13686:1103-1429(+)